MKKKSLFTIFSCAATAVIFLFIFNQQAFSSVQKQTISFLIDWKMGSFYAPYLLADEKGFYADEGLSVNIIEGQGAETSAKLIGQGKYKIGTCNAVATAIAIDNEIPITSIAMIEQNAVTAIFSLKKSNITSPSMLIGKTLGVRYYDISHKEYLAMMKANNLDPTKVKEVNVGWELQPLLTGQVDALYNYAYNMPVVLEQQGYLLNKILVKDNGVNGYGSNIIVNRDYVKNNEDVVKRFIRASKKGWEASLADPEAAIAVLKKRYPETDAKTALATLKDQLQWIKSDTESTKLFSQSDKRWNDILSTYQSLDIIKEKMPTDGIFANKYLD